MNESLSKLREEIDLCNQQLIADLSCLCAVMQSQADLRPLSFDKKAKIILKKMGVFAKKSDLNQKLVQSIFEEITKHVKEEITKHVKGKSQAIIPKNELSDKWGQCSRQFITDLKKRFTLTWEVGKIKATSNLPVLDKQREDKILDKMGKLAMQSHLDSELVKSIFTMIMNCVRQEHKSIKEKINPVKVAAWEIGQRKKERIQ